MTMTDEKLAEIEARSNAAESAPWRDTTRVGRLAKDVPALIAEVRRLREAVTEAEQAKSQAIMVFRRDRDKAERLQNDALLALDIAQAERDALRTEVARMRPVFDAAVARHLARRARDEGMEDGSIDVAESQRRVIAAIDAAEALEATIVAALADNGSSGGKTGGEHG